MANQKTRERLAQIGLTQSGDKRPKRLDGYVYVLTNEAFPGRVKIGISYDPDARLAQFETGSPIPYKMEYTARSMSAAHTEQCVHFLLADYHVRGEWFRITVAEAVEAIERGMRPGIYHDMIQVARERTNTASY